MKSDKDTRYFLCLKSRHEKKKCWSKFVCKKCKGAKKCKVPKPKRTYFGYSKIKKKVSNELNLIFECSLISKEKH